MQSRTLLATTLWLITAGVGIGADPQRPSTRLKLQCGGIHLNPVDARHPLEPREFSVSLSGICSQYTIKAGWEEPLVFYLGEGAGEFATQINIAAGVWTEATGFLVGVSVDPFTKPVNFTAPPTPWISSPMVEQNASDGQSVIYIDTSGEPGLAHGFAQVRSSRIQDRIFEADLYITAPGASLETPVAIPSYAGYADSDHGIFAIVDDLYSVILHEMGHAMGLNHVPTSGNLMSLLPHTAGDWNKFYNRLWYLERMRDETDPSALPIVFRAEDMWGRSFIPVDTEKLRLAWSTFSFELRPGPQDLAALMCVYEAP